MLFKKDRKRRVIYNDDSDQQFIGSGSYPYDITDEQSFIDARTTPTFDTHVDTYVWCVGNGCEPPWGPPGVRRRHVIRPCLGSCEHATNVIINACHDKGMEAWGSLRMNDLHDSRSTSLEKTNDPLKAQHPEYLIGSDRGRLANRGLRDSNLPDDLVERDLWTAFNFERPEVRQYRLDFIKRNAAAHDFDGYELDFTRFIWNFPLGRERDLTPLMTGFVQQVRAALNTIAESRGRPYTLVAHVTDSVETSLLLGHDVETWLAGGLVDVLVVGMGYVPFSLRMEQWRALGDRYGVPIYPALNTRRLFRLYKETMKRLAAWDEYMRATAALWWHNRADGIYIFNLFCQEAKNVGPMDKKRVNAPLKEVGDPALLAGKDKLYGIEPFTIAGKMSQGTEASPLPIPLDIHERRLPLAMGPDADDAHARFEIYAWSTGEHDGTKVWMRLNHTLLEPVYQDGHYTVKVPEGLMRVGGNELAIWCNAKLAETVNPIIVHEVLISVVY